MNRILVGTTVVLIALFARATPFMAADAPATAPQCAMKRIALASFGTGSAGQEFRQLLEAQLEQRGFTLVAATDAPEATLEGSARTEQHVSSTNAGHSGNNAPAVSTSTDAYVTVKVSAPDGSALWRHFFKPNFSLSHLTRPPLERRAIEVADAFVKQCGKGWPHDAGK